MVSLLSNIDWKLEPESPPSLFPLDYESDIFMFDEDGLANPSPESLVIKQDHSYCNSPASEELDDLDEWIKREPFSDWLEEKIDLPNLNSLPVVDNHSGVEAVKLSTGPVFLPRDTRVLLREFEDVYETVELNNNAALTPPQSPGMVPFSPLYSGEQEVLLATLQQVPAVQAFPMEIIAVDTDSVCAEKEDTILQSLDQIIPATPSSDVAQELKAVDDWVRSCVESLVEKPYDPTPPPSDDSESEFSCNKQINHYPSPPSPSTTSNSSYTSTEEDPDWSPSSLEMPVVEKSSRPKKRGPKPYSRPGPDERRQRKKEQNKNAATRYRQKKKAEIEVIVSEEKGLEMKNAKLHEKVEDLQREVKYLKGLMRDVFKAKGLIK